MPYVTTADGTTLFYNDWGSGTPVILIHGWPLDADMWEYQMMAMAAHGHRVIAYDRRGFGRSSQPWEGYDYNTFADDLKTIIDSLQLSNVALVGFSMGGGEVARYMSRHGGKNVAKAVLVSAVTPLMLQTEGHPDGIDRAVFDAMVAQLKADRPHFLASFGKTFFGAGMLNFTVTNEILTWAENTAMLASPKATIDCVRAFSETDFRGDMGAFKVPTLIIHGDADATVPIDVSARSAARMIEGASLKEYSGAPHGLFFTHKEQLTNDLLLFLGA